MHVILFPEHRASSLPFRVIDWLGRWAAARTFQDATVGVIKDAKAADLTKPVLSELSRFARKHGLSFIVDEDRPAKNWVRLPVRFPPELEAALPIAETYLAGLTTRSCYRSFGINE
jgi:hypothetical protein